MDCSLDKKLVGRSQPKYCGKWLSGKWAPPGGGRSQVVPSGVSLGTRALQCLAVAWMMKYSTPSARLKGSINREVAIRMREGIVILSQLALVHGIALTHVNILAHGLVDLHNVLIDPPL